MLILAAILVAALLVARTCGSTAADISKDEAIEIARGRIDFEAPEVQIRLVKRGLDQNEVWLVGLGRRDDVGNFVEATNVLVDADTGEVIEVRKVG